MNFLKSAKIYADMIKIGHTLFALPFALSALCLAYAEGYSLTPAKIFWTIIAFAAARSAAMGFNRVADADIDAINPRTKNRPTASGKIAISAAKFFTFASAAVFVFSAYMINSLCFWLSFPALALLFGYSYMKRFSAAAHYVLGAALALAPVGAWIAAADSFDPRILALGFALLFHISGFDLIYALQDREFDISHGLHSVPARFGIRGTLGFASFSFFAAALCLVLTGIIFALPTAYFATVGVISALYAFGVSATLKYETAKVDLVFFYESVTVSFLILFGVATKLF